MSKMRLSWRHIDISGSVSAHAKHLPTPHRQVSRLNDCGVWQTRIAARFSDPFLLIGSVDEMVETHTRAHVMHRQILFSIKYCSRSNSLIDFSNIDRLVFYHFVSASYEWLIKTNIYRYYKGNRYLFPYCHHCKAFETLAGYILDIGI